MNTVTKEQILNYLLVRSTSVLKVSNTDFGDAWIIEPIWLNAWRPSRTYVVFLEHCPSDLHAITETLIDGKNEYGTRDAIGIVLRGSVSQYESNRFDIQMLTAGQFLFSLFRYQREYFVRRHERWISEDIKLPWRGINDMGEEVVAFDYLLEWLDNITRPTLFLVGNNPGRLDLVHQLLNFTNMRVLVRESVEQPFLTTDIFELEERSSVATLCGLLVPYVELREEDLSYSSISFLCSSRALIGMDCSPQKEPSRDFETVRLMEMDGETLEQWFVNNHARKHRMNLESTIIEYDDLRQLVHNSSNYPMLLISSRDGFNEENLTQKERVIKTIASYIDLVFERHLSLLGSEEVLSQKIITQLEDIAFNEYMGGMEQAVPYDFERKWLNYTLWPMLTWFEEWNVEAINEATIRFKNKFVRDGLVARYLMKNILLGNNDILEHRCFQGDDIEAFIKFLLQRHHRSCLGTITNS